MKCPYCGKEMREGYFQSGAQPIQWIPKDSKPSIWKTGVAKGAVVMGEGSLMKSYQAEAFCCSSCKIVIVPVK